MKKSLLAISALAVLTIVSCDKKDSDPIETPPPGLFGDTLRGQITDDVLLKENKVYYLDGPVFIKGNKTLTIQKGAIVKAIKTGKTPASAAHSYLVITRGSKIHAEGTETQPIVFTSAEAKGSRATGDWGGLMILGKAKVNTTYMGQPGRQMEGFSDDNAAAYGEDIVGGGLDDNDNSGVLKYVRVEFAGIALSNKENSELNSITFIGVGRNTVIDYVQSSFSGDDSFEWFGGSVNAKHLIAFRGLDDEFDTDNGFSGKVQFALSIRDKNFSDYALPGDSNGFESDNDPDGTDAAPVTSPVFSNVTFVGPYSIDNGAGIPGNAVFNRGAHLRRNTKISIFNSVFAGYVTGVYIDGAKSGASAQANSLEIKNTFVGNITGTKGGKAGDKLATNAAGFDIKTWFMTPAFGNDTSLADIAGFKFAKMTGALSGIDARPLTGSPLLGKASFTSSDKIKDSFFAVVDYVGAFGVNDNWATGWTNFDPVNANY